MWLKVSPVISGRLQEITNGVLSFLQKYCMWKMYFIMEALRAVFHICLDSWKTFEQVQCTARLDHVLSLWYSLWAFTFMFSKLLKVENLLRITADKLCDKSPSFMNSRIVVLISHPSTSTKYRQGRRFRKLTKN